MCESEKFASSGSVYAVNKTPYKLSTVSYTKFIQILILSESIFNPL